MAFNALNEDLQNFIFSKASNQDDAYVLLLVNKQQNMNLKFSIIRRYNFIKYLKSAVDLSPMQQFIKHYILKKITNVPEHIVNMYDYELLNLNMDQSINTLIYDMDSNHNPLFIKYFTMFKLAKHCNVIDNDDDMEYVCDAHQQKAHQMFEPLCYMYHTIYNSVIENIANNNGGPYDSIKLLQNWHLIRYGIISHNVIYNYFYHYLLLQKNKFDNDINMALVPENRIRWDTEAIDSIKDYAVKQPVLLCLKNNNNCVVNFIKTYLQMQRLVKKKRYHKVKIHKLHKKLTSLLRLSFEYLLKTFGNHSQVLFAEWIRCLIKRYKNNKPLMSKHTYYTLVRKTLQNM